MHNGALIFFYIFVGVQKPSVWVSAHAEGIYPRSQIKSFDETYMPDNEQQDNDVNPTKTKAITENMNYNQRLCYDWEKSAMLPTTNTDDGGDTDKIRHVGVRIGLVLGRNGGFIQQSYLPFWMGLGGVVGSGNQKFPWVHINDCANIFVKAIEDDGMHGFYNAISPGQCDSADFTRAFGKALRRPAFMWIPGFMIRALTGADRAPLILDGSRIKPKRTLESGFEFEFDDIDKAMVDIVNTNTK